MRITTIKQLLLFTLLLSALTTACQAQTDDGHTADERIDGRYLLDLGYTQTDSYEGFGDAFIPGLTWLVSADIRLGLTTSFIKFNPSSELGLENDSSSYGLGDTIFLFQYDWKERLTASPWVPDDLGTSVAILAPTGNAKKFLSEDTWGIGLSTGWPILIKDEWLLNPTIAYNFTFSEGALAEDQSVVEIGLGIVKLFPSKFWIGFTPVVWYDTDDKTYNYDDHFTIGKMFSNGVGVGLDYGTIGRAVTKYSRYDKSLFLNFYYQFGKQR